MTAVAPSIGELLVTVRKNHPEADLRQVLSAYDVAVRWHEGQTRLSGEPYVTHPVAVATIVAELGLGLRAVCAAILHDLLDDTPYTVAQMRAEFGDDVAMLVERLSDEQLLHIMRAAVTGEAEAQLSQQDTELLVVKLADRLHNMRTLRHISVSKQIHKSRQTLELAAPVAHRLGLLELKRELEDLALQVLRPPALTVRPRGTMRLLGLMVLLLPAHTQQRWREEWTAELSMLPGRRQRARFTWQTLIGVPRLALTLQRSRDREAPPWTVSLARIARTLGITGTIVAVTAPGPVAVWVFGGVTLAALGLFGALLFARSDAPSRRLLDLIKAFGGYRAAPTRYPED
jgi:hypothetical protein